MRLAILYLIAFLPINTWAQFTYTFDQSIPVEVDGRMLKMPWAGGLNSVQVNKMDLNSDGVQDLVLFDRAANKIVTFLTENNQHTYHPEYEPLFPKEITRWVLLRDYNCDGKQDLFTANNNGISVFLNKTQPNGNLDWQKLQFFVPPPESAPPGTTGIFTDILLTQGFSKTNIFPGSNDIPSITDMDGDGDLDIVNIRFVNPFAAEYHKNMSKENYGTCDSLEYVRITNRWGDWEECDCGDFAFGESCVSSGGRTNHSVGKSLLIIDSDGDGNKDIFFAEEDCPVLYFLRNGGTTENADFNTAVPFPQQNPAFIRSFPAAYYEDVDFDNKPDLILSPAVYARVGLNNPFTNSVWQYKNVGTAQAPNFTLTKNNFLQDEMIEVGDYASPAFFDYDGDEDQDMFIGNYGNSQFIGVIALFENIGSAASPSFRLVTNDFLGLSQLVQYSIKPQFADLNSDGNMDLVFTLADPTRFLSNLLYIPGKSPNTLDFSGQQVLATGFEVGANENILVVDVDQDGKVDLLVGTSDGALQYWRNGGSFVFSLENPSFMGLGTSITRSNLSASVADLDNDGRQDLIIGDQGGRISIYGDFRNTQFNPQAVNEIIFDPFSQSYLARNLGGRIRPVAVNIFNTDKPALVVGTVDGGVVILRNDEGQNLPEEPQIAVYPNPVARSEKLSVKTDRNVLMQLFTIMGQKLTEPIFIAGNQTYSTSVDGLASGLYIARFTSGGKKYSRKFVVY